MKPTSIFQMIVLAAFVFFILVGVVAFATYKGAGQRELPEMELWGTLDAQTVNAVAGDVALRNQGLRIKYVEKDTALFERDLLDALAGGTGPDIVIFPHDLLARHADKLLTIPSDSFSEREFKDQFVSAGEVFLVPGGAKGLPFLVDPLVMYWNRSLLSTNGIARPPRYWDEFFTTAPLVTAKESSGTLSRSFVALGEYSNVTNAKAILSALILQGGNAIVGRNSEGALTALLGLRGLEELSPVESAIRFYTDFSNPSKAHYSWNRGLPESREFFAAGKLGLYFGHASELGALRAKNPNLDFDLAPFPQTRDAARAATYANVYGVAIPRSVSDPQSALRSALILTGPAGAGKFAEALGLPPSRRDLLAEAPQDPYKVVLYRAALQALSWLDPDREETDGIFSRLVSSVTSGKSRISEAVNRAQVELQSLLFGISNR